MLYKLDNNKQEIELMPFCDFSTLKKKEKDLENLLANNLSELFVEDGQLMTIFQERAMQEEPDLVALDKDGNLVIFELKRGEVSGDTTIQIMRYAQMWGQMSYFELDEYYAKYCEKNNVVYKELNEAHKDAFGLEISLPYDGFNKNQYLIIVGSSSDTKLIEAVDYWKSRGLRIDFIPYRIYEISGEYFFEFFSKPYDTHINPVNRKGIIFDTNRSWDENAIKDMLEHHKISAYGDVAKAVNSFKKGDYVFYYHVGYGIVAAGRIKSTKSKENKKNSEYELYHDVELLTPEVDCSNIDMNKVISYSELCELLKKNFYLAKTAKVPYLTEEESRLIIHNLNAKFE